MSQVNARTLAMLAEAGRLSGVRLVVTQGRNPGGVAASAGTHDGWGVVDLRSRDFDEKTKRAVLVNLRRVGFAAWLRVPPSFTEHIHAVAVGDPGLSSEAKDQVDEYRAGGDGLRGTADDTGPDGYRRMTWEQYLRIKAASAAETGNDMQWTDKVPGTDVSLQTVGQRTVWLYENSVEGGAFDRRFDAMRDQIAQLQRDVARLTALIEAKS